MLKELIQSLNQAKAEVKAMEAKVERELKEALATIHSQHGFDSVDSFIQAVKKASRDVEAKGRKAADRAFPRAKRTQITAAIRATVKNLVAAGKSGAEIAEAAGISSASVQNIKKALGLVRTAEKKGPGKARAKKKAAPAAAKRKAAPKRRRTRSAPKKTAAPAAASAHGSASAEAPAAPPA